MDLEQMTIKELNALAERIPNVIRSKELKAMCDRISNRYPDVKVLHASESTIFRYQLQFGGCDSFWITLATPSVQRRIHKPIGTDDDHARDPTKPDRAGTIFPEHYDASDVAEFFSFLLSGWYKRAPRAIGWCT